MEITLEKRRRPGRAGRWAVNGLCLVVAVLALGFILPAIFGLQRYVITGGSMTGTYDLGSVVFEENVPVEDLRVGDVITYVPPAESGIDTLVTHRIVEKDGDTLRTQGDANPDVDPWTFQLTDDTQNRVRFHVPYVGYAFIALGDRATRIAVIGLPAAVIALYSLAELVGALRRRPRPDPEDLSVDVPGQRTGDDARTPIAGAGT